MQISVREISKRLADQVETVAPMLLPGGKRVNGDWCAGDLTGNAGKSLKVCMEGEHAGRWRDWAAGEQEKGDLIDLWRETRGLTPGEAIRQAKDFLGIVDIAPERQRQYATPPQNGSRAITQPDSAYRYLTVEREIPPSILNRYKVETKVGAGSDPCIAFPCYGPDGSLVNRSYRSLPPKGEKKRVWQDNGCAPCLFGWHALPESALATRTILLCEGQIDCMSWATWGIPALSISNGGGGTWIDYEWDNLSAFDHIYISFDMDGAGAKFAATAIERLGRHRCLIVKLPHKDANECLLNGATKEDAEQWIKEAKPPQIQGLVRAPELRKRLMEELRPKPEPFTLAFLRISWPHEGLWFREGEVTVWVGITSAGKSTFLNYMCVGLVVDGNPVFIASMEVKAETSLKKMVVPFAPMASDHEKRANQFLDEVGHLIVFADVIGYISQDKLFEMMQFSFQRYGVTHFIIDSLMRIDGLEEDYPAQGKFLNRLQEFAKSTGAHIHLVAHSKKISADAKPSSNDIKGSSLIANNADNIVAVCRNYEKDKMRKDGTLKADDARKMHDTEIRVEKQRDTGWTGSFFLKFNHMTYSYGKMKLEDTLA